MVNHDNAFPQDGHNVINRCVVLGNVALWCKCVQFALFNYCFEYLEIL